jgi:uncharacterized protein YecT (DUF1311 family)
MTFSVHGAIAFAVVATAFAAACPPSMAQHMNAADAPCRSGSANAQISQCFSAAYQDADKKLNDVYRRVVATLGPEDQKALQAAQLLWIRFRDANCEVEHGLYKGGSAAPMVLDACLEALTRQRADDLMTMLGYRLQR